ncbi:MAG TPA: hypothetical protein VF727_07765 [Allosphingosinicella sp.]
MVRSAVAAIGGVVVSCMFATAAFAQAGSQPGAELIGQSASIESGGVTNTVWFDPGGTARIVTPAGMETPAQWYVQNQQICLQSATDRECWPYQAAFQAGQPVTLTSDCGSTTRWTANSTAPMAPPPIERRAGERG